MNHNFETTYNELTKFSETLLSLGDPIADLRLERFEDSIGFKLPEDFKYFINKHNGFSLMATEVLGIGNEFKDASLDKLYYFEHEEVGNPMPKEFLPFSPDGYGNHYCLDLSRLDNVTCPVVFWQHDYQYSNISEVENCNHTFTDWINEVMIEWTLEEYDYDGSEK